jgi:hypothetical protein
MVKARKYTEARSMDISYLNIYMYCYSTAVSKISFTILQFSAHVMLPQFVSELMVVL